MKQHIVTIETRYTTECYLMPLDLSKSELCQVDKMLAEIGFCEDYTLIAWEEVTAEYLTEREVLLKAVEDKYKKCMDDMPLSMRYATVEYLQLELREEENEW